MKPTKLIICLVFLLASCRIDGRVADIAGQGLAGTTIYLSSENKTMETTTDGNGWFCFGDPTREAWRLPPGNYLITPSRPGYCFFPDNQMVSISSGTLGDLGEVWIPVSEVDFKSSNIVPFIGMYRLKDFTIKQNGKTMKYNVMPPGAHYMTLAQLLNIDSAGNINFLIGIYSDSNDVRISIKGKIVEVIDTKTIKFISSDGCIFNWNFELIGNSININLPKGAICSLNDYSLSSVWEK